MLKARSGNLTWIHSQMRCDVLGDVVPDSHCDHVCLRVQTYWVHEETGATSWTKPGVEGVKFVARKSVVASDASSTAAAELREKIRAKAAANLNLPRVDTAKSNIRKRGLSRGFRKRGASASTTQSGATGMSRRSSAATSHFGGVPSRPTTAFTEDTLD